MLSFNPDVITAFLGVCASVGAGVAGIFRFRAWWSDRVRQARIESATHLRDKGTEAWEVQLGNEQLRRIHFATLTEIDRTSGHESLRRCQQRLGGTDSEWRLLKNVGGFLDTSRSIARVRKPGWWALIGFFSCAAFSALMAFIALVIAGLVAAEFDKVQLSAVRLPQAFMFVVAVVWATLLAFAAVLAGSICVQIVNAFQLYRKMLATSKSRRAARLRAPRRGHQALDLPPAASEPKPARMDIPEEALHD